MENEVKKDPKDEKGCCGSCPEANCEGCDCSKPEVKVETAGCCMGAGCACSK